MKTNRSRASFLSAIQALLILFSLFAQGAQELQTFKNCTFVPTNWADGDSFQIKKTDGKLMTIRIYAADCLETDPMDDTDTNHYFNSIPFSGTLTTSVT